MTEKQRKRNRRRNPEPTQAPAQALDLPVNSGLSLRRAFAFAIDLTVVLVLILAVEAAIGLYILYFTDIQLYGGKPFGVYSRISDLHLLLTPLLLGLLTSQILDGRSPGFRLLGLRLVSIREPLASLIGCTLRAILVLGPAYLYFFLVAMPYAKSQGADGLAYPELSLLLFLCILIPISVALGHGQAGIHDSLLRTHVESTRLVRENAQYATSSGSALPAVIAALVLGLAMAGVIESSGILPYEIKKFSSQTRHLQERQRAEQDLSEQIQKRLSDPDVARVVLSSAFGFSAPSVPPSVLAFNRLPADAVYPTVLIWVGGSSLRNIEETQATLSVAIAEVASLNRLNRFLLIIRRQVHLDLFALSKDTECFFPGRTATSAYCIETASTLFGLFSWAEEVRSVE